MDTKEKRKQDSTAFAVLGLVFGVLGMAFFWIAVYDAVFVAAGLDLSVWSIKSKRGGKDMAVAGLICSIIGIVAMFIGTAVLIGVLAQYDDHHDIGYIFNNYILGTVRH